MLNNAKKCQFSKCFIYKSKNNILDFSLAYSKFNSGDFFIGFKHVALLL